MIIKTGDFKLKLQLPDVNVTQLEEKIKLKVDFPLLNDILELLSKEITLIHQIFDLLPTTFKQNDVGILPIRVDCGDTMSVSNASIKSDESGYESISVASLESKELLKMFGIGKNSIKITRSSAINNNNLQKNYIQNSKDTIKHFKLNQTHYLNCLSDIQENAENLKAYYRSFIYKSEDIKKPPTTVETNRPERNLLYHFEEKIAIGVQAELYFYLYLEHKYGELLDSCWISSAKNIFFPNDSFIDDKKGYDFEIVDTKNIFSQYHSKTCLIEVKGFSKKWDGTIFLSNNEVQKKNQTKKDEIYLVVIIENVSKPNEIRIAETINWTQNEEKLRLIEEVSFKYTYTEYNY